MLSSGETRRGEHCAVTCVDLAQSPLSRALIIKWPPTIVFLVSGIA